MREPENPPQIAPDRVTSEASIRLLRNLTESLNRAAPVPLPEQHTLRHIACSRTQYLWLL